jgi:hypothetical protein
MEDYFFARFQRKSKIELQRIIDNPEQYRPEAVSAAIKVLNKKLSEEDHSIPDNGGNKTNEPPVKTDRFSQSLDYNPFFRTLSYREFLTSISLAFFGLAIIEIINYYSDELFFKDTSTTWKLAMIFFIFLVNHIIYKCEHKRSNNFIGRSINDLLLFITLIFLSTSYKYIVGGTLEFRIDNPVLGSIIIVTLTTAGIFFFEIGLGFLKMLLKKIKCQIF